MRQSSLTFTHVCRNTLQSKNLSISCLAKVLIFLSIAPFLPIIMRLCVSRSQKIVASMSRMPLPRVFIRSMSTAVP